MALVDPKTIAQELIRQFDQQNTGAESALKSLVELLPSNVELQDVLVKAVTINSLYSAQVYAIESMARHIHALNIDVRLAAGDYSLVEQIANLSGYNRKFLSFASKYCSWHQPEKFPIYDSQAVRCLSAYAKQDAFDKFRDEELRDYGRFVGVIDRFRAHYELEHLNYKELDKFLYTYGGKLAAEYVPKRRAAKA